MVDIVAEIIIIVVTGLVTGVIGGATVHIFLRSECIVDKEGQLKFEEGCKP